MLLKITTPITIILFRHHFHLKNPLKLEELKELKIIHLAPQTINEISNELYQIIKERGGIDEHFAIH